VFISAAASGFCSGYAGQGRRFFSHEFHSSTNRRESRIISADKPGKNPQFIHIIGVTNQKYFYSTQLFNSLRFL
jgi:hypothetical protein